ncbi:MAG TPA: LLM class flavin-dependent oxidoreductase [Actinocrinis sp.]|nr:LLM class flavin-dependent oxidoreductase [Actinocrinis sp.]
MEFFSFHLMPWPHLPEDYQGSAWITAPNALYDPQLGHHLYHRYLDELEYADQVGFDGLILNEHHQTAYGLMPSPNLFAAMLARRTERAKIAVIGNALPLYHPPTRVAEEYAVLDVVTGGRLIAGMVLGGAPEYHYSGLNPTEARRRFAEALDLVVAAWTRPGPFEFDGEFYRLRYVNPWPRPLQQPHPPIWIPGIGSRETMELVAARGYSYVGLPFFHSSVFEANYRVLRRTWLAAGRPPQPEKLGLLLPIYVADTDAKARAEYEEHFWYFTRRLQRGVETSAPGYNSAASAFGLLSALEKFSVSLRDWREVQEGGYAIVGSPQTVAEKLAELVERLGVGVLAGLFQLGTLPHEQRAHACASLRTVPTCPR